MLHKIQFQKLYLQYVIIKENKKKNKQKKKQTKETKEQRKKNKNKRSKPLIPVLEEVVKISIIIFESHQRGSSV